MDFVYLVHHTYEVDLNEEPKLIGIYSTREKAEQVIEMYKKKIGFRDYLDGFYIISYEVDRNHWQEGFLTIDYKS